MNKPVVVPMQLRLTKTTVTTKPLGLALVRGLVDLARPGHDHGLVPSHASTGLLQTCCVISGHKSFIDLLLASLARPTVAAGLDPRFLVVRHLFELCAS